MERTDFPGGHYFEEIAPMSTEQFEHLRQRTADKVSEATGGKYQADTLISPGPGPDRSNMNRAQRREADREYGPVSPIVERFGPAVEDGLQAE